MPRRKPLKIRAEGAENTLINIHGDNAHVVIMPSPKPFLGPLLGGIVTAFFSLVSGMVRFLRGG